MKHFITFFALAMMACVTAVGCKSEPVDFQLDVGGSLYEATTHISAEVTAHVANVDALYFLQSPSAATLLTPQDAAPYKWLLENVKQPIIEKVGKGGKYDVTVTGYVSWHGLKFEVNEHWKSPDALAATNSFTTSDGTGYYIAQDKSRWRGTHARTLTRYARFDYVGY